jgi:sugar phosphate permease
MAWLVCLSAGLFFFYEFFQLNLFDVINSQIRSEFNINAAQISWMSSTYLWADILFLLPAGIILDRYSPRLVILLALFVCITGTVGFALATSFFYASFFHFLSGIGNAFCFLSCVVLINRWFPSQRQAFVIGCVVTMAFIGGMMAHTPLAYLNEHFGWRNSLLIDGGVGGLFFIWILLIVRDTPKHAISEFQSMQKQGNITQALVNKQNWLAGLYTCFLNLPIMVLCALWGANYLKTVHQLSGMEASNIISLILIGSIIGCPLAGWISDKLRKRKPVMLVGVLGTLVLFIPLFLNVTLELTQLGWLFFLLGLFTSTQVISYPLIAESNEATVTGSATGVASVIIMGGAGVAQVIFGMLMHLHAQNGLYAVSDFTFAMWMFPITTGVAVLALFFIKETNCNQLKVMLGRSKD